MDNHEITKETWAVILLQIIMLALKPLVTPLIVQTVPDSPDDTDHADGPSLL